MRRPEKPERFTRRRMKPNNRRMPISQRHGSPLKARAIIRTRPLPFGFPTERCAVTRGRKTIPALTDSPVSTSARPSTTTNRRSICRSAGSTRSRPQSEHELQFRLRRGHHRRQQRQSGGEQSKRIRRHHFRWQHSITGPRLHLLGYRSASSQRRFRRHQRSAPKSLRRRRAC